ncbi:hypothetical protein, partial [Caulobacter sp. HMWF009]|uniref:hypothetical protein n=1 Tax=Caulobacter sp. HMWF009 TaxID=2056846 RepID=UPI001E59F563
MARVLSASGQGQVALSDGWTLCLTPAGACVSPSEAAGLTDWVPAGVRHRVQPSDRATWPCPLADRTRATLR